MLKPFVAVALLLGLASPALAKCQAGKIETDINAVRIGDEISVERALGRLDTLPIGASEKDPSESDMPTLVLFNKDKSEVAILTKHPGDTPGSFMEIEVRPAADSRLVGKTLQAEHLATERGIRLGVPVAFVMERLGDCFTKTSSKGKTTLEYALDDADHAYLKRVNMPSYYGRYTFRGGKLVGFAIGSEMP